MWTLKYIYPIRLKQLQPKNYTLVCTVFSYPISNIQQVLDLTNPIYSLMCVCPVNFDQGRILKVKNLKDSRHKVRVNNLDPLEVSIDSLLSKFSILTRFS